MSGTRVSEAESPAAIVPRDLSYRAGSHTIRAWKWSTASPPAKATLVIAHGLFEHALCYDDIAEHLAQELELDVIAFDFRGHGRSEGRRGVVLTYDEFQTDLTATIDYARGEHPSRPVYLLAHSNGGLVALRTLRDEGHGIAGMILSNPAIKLAAYVPPWKLMVAGLLKHVPNVTLNAGLPTEGLNFHPDYIAERLNDPLLHSRINGRLYFGMREVGDEVTACPDRIRIPLLYLVGGRDGIINAQANLDYYEKIASSDKTLKFYPSMMHEPLHENGLEEVKADVLAWLRGRIGDA